MTEKPGPSKTALKTLREIVTTVTQSPLASSTTHTHHTFCISERLNLAHQPIRIGELLHANPNSVTV